MKWLRQPEAAVLTRPLFQLFAHSVFRVWCPLSVEGVENLPSQPFILCSNHNSHMDSAALIEASGLAFHCFAMLAARDYFFRSVRVLHSFGAMVELIPVDRSPGPKDFEKTIALCRRFMEDPSHRLILFPEGTRSRTGEIGAFKGGAALFAYKLALPVVPAYIHGTRAALPVGSFFPRPHHVRITFGQPIHPPESTGAKERECFQSCLRASILSMEARTNAG